MLGVALAFVSSIFWGASDFAGGVSSRRATALSATLWSFVAATVASAAATAIFPGTWSGTALVVGAVAGALGVCGFLTLYAALASAPMGVVTVIVGAVEAIVPVVVACSGTARRSVRSRGRGSRSRSPARRSSDGQSQ